MGRRHERSERLGATDDSTHIVPVEQTTRSGLRFRVKEIDRLGCRSRSFFSRWPVGHFPKSLFLVARANYFGENFRFRDFS